MTITEQEIEEHPFPPFIPANATTLIIGSFPGMDQIKNKSSKDEWFYTAAGNLFWITLSSVYQTELKSVEDKKKLCNTYGIGITDIFLNIKRKKPSNLDQYLIAIDYNDKAIESILEKSKIKLIFFTSKFVENHFQKKFPQIKNTVCLPSPSGAANRRISMREDYKNYIKENPEGNTKTFRVYTYGQLLR